jgi:hypothetical protein
MSMSLRLHCVIARPKYRTADISVEKETQFAPATLLLERPAQSTMRTWRRRE